MGYAVHGGSLDFLYFFLWIESIEKITLVNFFCHTNFGYRDIPSFLGQCIGSDQISGKNKRNFASVELKFGQELEILKSYPFLPKKNPTKKQKTSFLGNFPFFKLLATTRFGR